jgi:HD superfamily phosphohydrolase
MSTKKGKIMSVNKPNTPLKLSYYIPFIGHIEVELRNESKMVYEWLDEAGEIARLKNLDHLGAIRFAWEGAHHPRWEYIFFILYLIDYCRKNVKEVHLSSKVKIPNSIEVSSGSELLKCWVLLFNVGHLEWTFLAERALLLELRRLNKCKNFLDLFSDDENLKEWAKDIIDKCNFYHFFQALAFIRLDAIAKSKKPSEKLKWKEIMKTFVKEKNKDSKISKLIKLYLNLRRLAYLTLDPYYTPAGLQLNPAQLFSSPSLPILSRILEPNTTEEKAFSALEHLLYEDVYLSEKVIRTMSERESNLRKEISDKLRESELNKIIDDLANGTIQQKLVKKGKKTRTIVRLSFWLDPSSKDLIPEIPHPCSFQSDLESAVPEKFKQKLSFIIWPGPDKNTFVAQFHALDRNREAKLLAYYCALKYVHLLRKNLKLPKGKKYKNYEKLLFEKLAAELIIKALHLINNSRKKLRWEWHPINDDEPIAIFTSAHVAKEYLEEILNSNKGISESIKGEITAKLNVLKILNIKGFIALSIGRLEAYKNKERFCEIDGCLVYINKDKNVEITLIEAKTSKSKGKTKAENQLERTLDKLNVLSKKDIITDKQNNISYAYITIPLKVA